MDRHRLQLHRASNRRARTPVVSITASIVTAIAIAAPVVASTATTHLGKDNVKSGIRDLRHAAVFLVEDELSKTQVVVCCSVKPKPGVASPIDADVLAVEQLLLHGRHRVKYTAPGRLRRAVGALRVDIGGIHAAVDV